MPTDPRADEQFDSIFAQPLPDLATAFAAIEYHLRGTSKRVLVVEFADGLQANEFDAVVEEPHKVYAVDDESPASGALFTIGEALCAALDPGADPLWQASPVKGFGPVVTVLGLDCTKRA